MLRGKEIMERRYGAGGAAVAKAAAIFIVCDVHRVGRGAYFMLRLFAPR